jgi:hypothetical protein
VQVISQFLRDEQFPSARVLVKKFAISPQIIKEIVGRGLDMRTFTRSWISHELTPANKAKRVEDARTLLQALISVSEKDFADIMTGNESWFCYGYELPIIFGHRQNKVNPRVSQTIGSKTTMITIFFTGNRFLKLVHLLQG